MELCCDGRMREEEGFPPPFEYRFENLEGVKQLLKDEAKRRIEET